MWSPRYTALLRFTRRSVDTLIDYRGLITSNSIRRFTFTKRRAVTPARIRLPPPLGDRRPVVPLSYRNGRTRGPTSHRRPTCLGVITRWPIRSFVFANRPVKGHFKRSSGPKSDGRVCELQMLSARPVDRNERGTPPPPPLMTIARVQ